MTVVDNRLRLSVDIAPPGGSTHSRWGLDEPNPTNIPGSLTFSSTMPGGFEQMGCTLTRHPNVDYSDLAEFSTITVYGAGGEIAWQGRLTATPRVSGDQLSISPAAVGWQAALADDQSARMIYLDCDLTQWQAASVQRQINIAVSLANYQGSTVIPDATTGQPALDVGVTFDIDRLTTCEAWYNAHGLPISILYYAWKTTGISAVDTNWTWQALLSSDDVMTATDTTGNLRAAGPGTGSRSATSARTFALVDAYYAAATTGVQGQHESVLWTYLGVVGNHGLTIQGALTATGGIGVLASDVIQHAVQTWAPELATSKAGVSTIEPTTFIIPNLAFTDPTTASNIITTALQYELLDWWVDEGPVFNLASRDNHGRDWRARVGPSGLQETGPDISRMVNRVIVSYNDVTGITRTVGPTGSGANTIDDTLADLDPSNPVTAAGLIIYPANLPNIGVSTPAGASAVGQAFLFYNRQLSTAGQASIVGTVQDSAGVTWPAWMIRAGDRITFTDAHDPVPRRIVRAQYTDDTKTCQIDLDSPASGLDALLARFAGSIKPLGF